MTEKQYYSQITRYGTQVINECLSSADKKLIASDWYIAIGTGDLIPTEDTEELVNPIYDKNSVNYVGISFGTDPNYGRYAKIIVPEEIQGSIIKELGLFDGNNKLICAAKTYADLSQKLSDGLAYDYSLTLYLQAIPSDVEIVYINPNAMATIEEVENKIDEKIGDIDFSSFELKANKGQANGFCPLDKDEHVPKKHLPEINNTTIKTYKDLMSANGKKIHFNCSEEFPVTVDFLDGTQGVLTNINDIDLSTLSAGTYPQIVVGKRGDAYMSGRVDYLPIDVNGNASGFTSSKFVWVGIAGKSFSQVVGNNPWEVVTKFTTGADVTTEQGVIGGTAGTYLPDLPTIVNGKFLIRISSNGSSYDICNSTGTHDVQPNTTYWTRTKFTGTQYIFEYSLDGVNYVEDVSATSSTPIEATSDMLMNGKRSGDTESPFLGSISLNDSKIYVNGKLWWTGEITAHESVYLGTVTLSADAITNLTNNYCAISETPLQEVKEHTINSAKDIEDESEGVLDLVPFPYGKLNYSSKTTVNAGTVTTFNKAGRFYANSLTTIKHTENGVTTQLSSINVLDVAAGDSFQPTVAGYIVFYY